MSVYRVTLFWGQATDGASETYWTADQTSSAAATNVQQMLALRSQLMTTNQYFQGVRAALEGAVRRSSVMLPLGGIFADSGIFVAVPASGTITPGGSSTNPDQFRGVLQMQLQYQDTRRTIRYLSGIPDAISATEPATINFSGSASWFKAYNAFTQYLITNGWQIRCQQVAPQITPFPVIGVVVQSAAPGLIGIQISATSNPGINKGQKVALHGFRSAKGTRGSTMNGTWYVDSIDVTTLPLYVTVYLRGSQGIDPNAQRFTDKTTLRPVTYTFAPIQALTAFRVGIHKRGRPTMAPRGRRLSRPSLDP